MSLKWLGTEVVGNSVVKDVTLSLDTSAYAAGDVLAATQEITTAMREFGGTGIWTSLMVIDKDDQGKSMKVYLFESTVTFGTENAAVSISDADAAKLLGIADVSSYEDLGGVQVAYLKMSDLGFVVQSASDSTSLFVAVESEGTGTYTASGVVLRLGFLRD